MSREKNSGRRGSIVEGGRHRRELDQLGRELRTLTESLRSRRMELERMRLAANTQAPDPLPEGSVARAKEPGAPDYGTEVARGNRAGKPGRAPTAT